MHSTLSSATTSRRRRVGLLAGLSASAAVFAAVVAGSPAFATDDSPVTSAIDKLDKNMWAIVDGQSGGLQQSDFHITSSFKTAHTLDGQGYRINFDRDIRQCAFFATLATTKSGDLVDPNNGIAITQNQSFATRQQLDVVTKTAPGEDPFFDASSFSLMVQC